MESRLYVVIKDASILSDEQYEKIKALLKMSLMHEFRERKTTVNYGTAQDVAEREYSRHSFLLATRDDCNVRLRVESYDQQKFLFDRIVEAFPQLSLYESSDSTFTNVRDVRAGTLTKGRKHLPA